jgi:hypothetical protein
VQRRRELIERRSAEALGNGAASGDWAGPDSAGGDRKAAGLDPSQRNGSRPMEQA